MFGSPDEVAAGLVAVAPDVEPVVVDEPADDGALLALLPLAEPCGVADSVPMPVVLEPELDEPLEPLLVCEEPEFEPDVVELSNGSWYC